jgi:hypothetical protein
MPLLGPINPLELARGVRAATSSASQRLRPDHLAIRQHAVQWYVGAPMTHFFLYAAVAPSRSMPRASDDGQVGRALTFVVDAFPKVFPETPAWADDRYTLFATEDPQGGRVHQLYVHRTGLIELLWALTPHPPAASAADPQLDAGEIVRVVGQLATAVAGDAYREISRAGRGRRRFARVDWWFQLTTSVSGDGSQRHWSGLKFTQAPPPRAAHQWPAAPLNGYAAEGLGHVRRQTPSFEIANALLGEVVKANGYYAFADSVEETVRATLQNRRELNVGPPAQIGHGGEIDAPDHASGLGSSPAEHPTEPPSVPSSVDRIS